MRQQKDEELEQYKKEIERAKRFEAQKSGVGSAVASGSVATQGERIVVKKKQVGYTGPPKKRQ